MKNISVLCLLLNISLFVKAQGEKYPVSNPTPGLLAYASVPSAFSYHSNVASLAHYEKNDLSLFSERRFMIDELQFFSASAAYKLGQGRFGLALGYQGFNAYKYMHTGIAYAKKLGRISVGVKFNYLSERAGSYPAASTISGQAAMLLSVSPRLRFGWQLSNFPSTQRKNAGKLPAMYKAGLGYMASDDCVIGFELMKEENFPVNIHAGFSYTYRARFFITGGTQSATGSYYAGAGWAMKKFQLHLSVSHHPYLGFSPGLLLNHQY